MQGAPTLCQPLAARLSRQIMAVQASPVKSYTFRTGGHQAELDLSPLLGWRNDEELQDFLRGECMGGVPWKPALPYHTKRGRGPPASLASLCSDTTEVVNIRA